MRVHERMLKQNLKLLCKSTFFLEFTFVLPARSFHQSPIFTSKSIKGINLWWSLLLKNNEFFQLQFVF